MLRSARILLCEAKVTFKRSPHEVLGVDRATSLDDVRTQYLKLVTECHPDKGGSPEEFQAVKEAYEKITDGAPTYMMYSNERTFSEKLTLRLRERFAKIFESRGVPVDFEKMHDEYRVRGYATGIVRRLIIAGTLWWMFMWCEPAQPGYGVVLAVSYYFDYITAYRTLPYMLPCCVIHSILSGRFPSFYTPVGSYWAIDAANSVTMGYGVPNFRSREYMIEYNNARVGDAIRKVRGSYKRVIPEEEKETDTPVVTGMQRQAIASERQRKLEL